MVNKTGDNPKTPNTWFNPESWSREIIFKCKNTKRNTERQSQRKNVVIMEINRISPETAETKKAVS